MARTGPKNLQSKLEKIKNFNPNGACGESNDLFGLPFTAEESDVIVIPVPWEVTVSYCTGTANGPAAIKAASVQMDLHDQDIENAWHPGIYMLPIQRVYSDSSEIYRIISKNPIDHPEIKPQEMINHACKSVAEHIQIKSERYLKINKIPAIVGGDHSTPLGLMQALADKYDSFGVLHIDAHFDLREAYEGFTYSHASIMYNASKINNITQFAHVGIRDYCEEEAQRVEESNSRMLAWTNRDIRRRLFRGIWWQTIADEIVAVLPKNVYVSFDIDGLDPSLCPNTGTPVPGGLQFEEAFYLIDMLRRRNRTIIGFDLCEVAPASSDPATWAEDWNANVGMRALWRLATIAAATHKK